MSETKADDIFADLLGDAIIDSNVNAEQALKVLGHFMGCLSVDHTGGVEMEDKEKGYKITVEVDNNEK